MEIAVAAMQYHLKSIIFIHFISIYRLNGHNLIPETSYENLDEDSMERKVIDILTDFYANFAKFA